MMSLAGFVKAMFPYVEKIKLGPVTMTDDDQCKRILTIVSEGCILEIVLFGPTPETLEFQG